ncbi:MAG TPA: hypothetical protein VKB57_23695 [Acidimicrobiales bacterium]|nr:hypothetical protein [Acidimicrobiales bacterium]
MTTNLKPLCPFCGEPVDPQATGRVVYHRIAGWARRGNHGGSDVALREQIDGFAHAVCVHREQRKVSATQGMLL